MTSSWCATSFTCLGRLRRRRRNVPRRADEGSKTGQSYHQTERNTRIERERSDEKRRGKSYYFSTHGWELWTTGAIALSAGAIDAARRRTGSGPGGRGGETRWWNLRASSNNRARRAYHITDLIGWTGPYGFNLRPNQTGPVQNIPPHQIISTVIHSAYKAFFISYIRFRWRNLWFGWIRMHSKSGN